MRKKTIRRAEKGEWRGRKERRDEEGKNDRQ
jgi:hypothetical protein